MATVWNRSFKTTIASFICPYLQRLSGLVVRWNRTREKLRCVYWTVDTRTIAVGLLLILSLSGQLIGHDSDVSSSSTVLICVVSEVHFDVRDV